MALHRSPLPGYFRRMGMFDLVGTTASGWLTDRFDPTEAPLHLLRPARPLVARLAVHQVRRDEPRRLRRLHGLDWIATVPPTVASTNRVFGSRDAPVIFGWILVGHQIGAAVAAFGAGIIRSQMGSYSLAFLIAGSFAVVAGFATLIFPSRRAAAEPLFATG